MATLGVIKYSNMLEECAASIFRCILKRCGQLVLCVKLFPKFSTTFSLLFTCELTKTKVQSTKLCFSIASTAKRRVLCVHIHFIHFQQIMHPSPKLINSNNSFTLKTEIAHCSERSEHLITARCKKPKDCHCLNHTTV